MIDFRQAVAELIVKQTKLDINEIEQSIEIPPQEEMGDYAFPCFRLAKELKKNPAQIATEISQDLLEQKPEWLAEIKVAGPYLNFYLDRSSYARTDVD